MGEWKTSPCRGCGDPMVWTVTKNGKKMPVDPVEISRAEAGPKATLFELHDEPVPGERQTVHAFVTQASEGYLSHWATCPDREQFKR